MFRDKFPKKIENDSNKVGQPAATIQLYHGRYAVGPVNTKFGLEWYVWDATSYSEDYKPIRRGSTLETVIQGL